MFVGKEEPLVSIVIPIRNEEKYLKGLFESLKRQNYSHELLEIIFVDGNSEDKTIETIKELEKGIDITIKIIKNLKRIIPISMNLGIKEASGKYIVRMDAHAEYNSEYIMEGIKLLEEKEELVSVGGYLFIFPSENTIKSKITSKVFGSFLGTGNSSLRVNGLTIFKEGYNDTALYGIFRRLQLEKVNGYNEKLEVAQDIELFDRLKKTFNGKIWLTNKMKIKYYFKPKNGKELFKRQLRISLWTFKRNNGVRIRHIIPLVTGMLGIILLLFRIKILLLLMLLYILICIYFYAREIDSKKEVIYFPYAVYVYFINHLGYFLGTTISLIQNTKLKWEERYNKLYQE